MINHINHSHATRSRRRTTMNHDAMDGWRRNACRPRSSIASSPGRMNNDEENPYNSNFGSQNPRKGEFVSLLEHSRRNRRQKNYFGRHLARLLPIRRELVRLPRCALYPLVFATAMSIILPLVHYILASLPEILAKFLHRPLSSDRYLQSCPCRGYFTIKVNLQRCQRRRKLGEIYYK